MTSNTKTLSRKDSQSEILTCDKYLCETLRLRDFTSET